MCLPKFRYIQATTHKRRSSGELQKHTKIKVLGGDELNKGKILKKLLGDRSEHLALLWLLL